MKKTLSFFFFLFFLSPALWADISVQDLGKKFQVPNNQWKKDSPNTSDKEFLMMESIKLGKALTISGRTDDIPMDAKTYLTQIRGYLLNDKKTYPNARISSALPKTLFGKDWQMIRVEAPDGLHQELWARKLDATQVVLFLYTSIGEAFQNFHADFDKVLEQGAAL